VPAGRTSASTFLEAGQPHPSVVRYHAGGGVTTGREAKARLASTESGVIEDTVTSPKARLGSGQGYYVGGLVKEPSEVAADVLRHVRQHANEALRNQQLRLDHAVMTIPVDMDGRARQDLREGASAAGIDVIQFVHEPLAALYGHLRRAREPGKEAARLDNRMILVFDWGGGTLDITLCRVERGTLVQLLNSGDNEVGGDMFDQRLVHVVEDRHRLAHGLGPDVDLNRAALRAHCEAAKIDLSRREAVTVFVPDCFDAFEPAATVEVRLTRDDLEAETKHLIDRAFRNLDRLLKRAGLSHADVSLCLGTGGMAAVPAIRRRLVERFDIQRAPELPDAQLVIAEGAAWIAHDEAELQLAKPFELLHADDTYLPVLESGTRMPRYGQEVTRPVTLHCVDPRDGYARLLFARPARPRRTAPGDPRLPYTCLFVGVHAAAQPLAERVDVDVRIDADCVVHLEAKSSMALDRRETQIHDLEFGLSLKTLR
jgi:molecular chaperone DnaK